MDDKIKYIINNIDQLNDHTQIIEYLNLNNINYSQNNNGVFLNIKVLEENDIINIYIILNILIENHDLTIQNTSILLTPSLFKKSIELIEWNHPFSEIEWEFINKTKLNNII